MTHIANTNIIFSLCVIIFIVLAPPGIAVDLVTAHYIWDPPTVGLPVEYLVQLSINDGPWITVARPEEPKVTLTLSFNDDHRVQVAGVDIQGRQGPFSLPSETYNPSKEGAEPD